MSRVPARIVTLLGAARGAVAIGFYKDVMNEDISFFELTYYMFPIGWLMTFALWAYFYDCDETGKESDSRS